MLNDYLGAWLLTYLLQTAKRRAPSQGQNVHLLLCVADHFEPEHGKVGPEQALSRVRTWASNTRVVLRRFETPMVFLRDIRSSIPWNSISRGTSISWQSSAAQATAKSKSTFIMTATRPTPSGTNCSISRIGLL